MNKKGFYRILSFLLLVASLLSLLPVNSFAQEVSLEGIDAADAASINRAISAQQEAEAAADFDYSVSAPATQAFDLQPLYAVLTEAVDFAEAQGFAPVLYAAFEQRLQEAVIFYNNCNDPEQVGSLDLAAVEKTAATHVQVLSAYCRILTAMERGGLGTEEQLLAALNALDAAVPANEFVYVSDYGAGNMAGEYYIVNELTDANGKSVFYALDPITPSLYGKMTAKEVTLVGTAGTGNEALRGTALAGLHPEMALTFEYLETTGTTGRYNVRVGGEYNYLSTPTYINCWPQQLTTTTGYQTDLLLNTVNKYSDISSRMNLDVRSNGRVSFTYITPKDETSSTYCQYIALNTLTPNGDVYFEINTNSSNVAGSQTVYETYYKDKLPMVSSHLFRRLANRVYTDQLRDSLLSYGALLDGDSRYEKETFANFLSMLQEMLSLYVSYNGIDVDNRDAIEAELLDKQEDMLSVTGMLRINKQSEAGTKINSFKASVYRWDEAEYNALTLAKDTASTKKGFYFTSSNVAPAGVTLPVWSAWKTSNGYREFFIEKYAGVVKESRRYAIDSGLVKETITSTGSIINTSKTLEGIDLWAKTTMTSNGVKVREVYNNVSVPFIYDNATGYYTLDSDTNGVYFDGTPKNNASLKIADRPLSYSRYYSVPETGSYVGADERTYDINSEYISGFQPFAEISLRDWKSYPSSSVAANANPSQMVASYLPHGVATDQNYVTDYGDLGQPQWGVGMQLEIPFRITEDGKLDGEPITFNFSGDDDVWVYIDNQLVLDIGGTHDAIQGKIDFSTGTVYVSSAAHGYIRDNSGTYGKDTGLYDYSATGIANVADTNGTVTKYGESLGHGSVSSMKDGSKPVRMYQENIYTNAINGTAATADLIKAFSEEGAHTLKIYYMDRGRGRTNCKISFNLPTTDTVVVDKDICDTYGNLQTGGLTELKIPDSQMQKLLDQSFGFTIYRNDEPMANALYSIMEDNVEVGSGTTDANGHFTLLGKQTAEFRGEDLTLDNEYRVEEDALKGSWIDPTYSYRYSGTQSNASVSGEGNSIAVVGDPDASETLHLICTNYYSIAADPVDVVVDYGKPVEVEFRSRAMATAVSKQSFATASVRAELENPEHAAYGTFELFDSDDEDSYIDSLRYTPTDILPGIITIYCIFNVGGSLGEAPIPVRIIPATSVYYETDFSENAFENEVVGNDDESRQWQTIVESSSESGSSGTTETQSIELQDGGYTQEYIEEFVFDRGGEIPTNAFFVDFRNDDAAAKRFKSSTVYADSGTKNGYINYEDVTDTSTGYVKYWGYHTSRTTQPTLWWVRGRMHFKVLTTNTDGYFWYQTSNYKLNYHPDVGHYVQIRFKLNGLMKKSETEDSKVALLSCTSSAATEIGTGVIPDKAFSSGEYVTVSFPLYESAATGITKITSLRIHFDNVVCKDSDTQGEVWTDYIYVGPDNRANSSPATNHTYDYAPYLLFDFNNNTYAQRRYTGPLTGSYYGNKNLDKGYWAVDTVNPETGKQEILEPTYNTETMTVKIGPRKNNNGQYGIYVSPTKKVGYAALTGANDVQYHLMNFTPDPTKKCYVHVKFKLVDCKVKKYTNEDGVTQSQKLQFTVVNSSGTGSHPSTDYNLADAHNDYIIKTIDITSNVDTIGGTITSFYVRFANITNKTADTYGKAHIAWIYVGPESNTDYIFNNTQYEKNIWIDFNNSTHDKARYAGRPYGCSNYDQMDGWYNEYWFSYDFQTSNSLLRLKPTSNAITEKWGQIEAKNDDEKAVMSHYLTGNDYAVIRMRHHGLDNAKSSSLVLNFSKSDTGGMPSEVGAANAKQISKAFNAANDQWHTYVFNLAEVKSHLGNWFNFFSIAFNNISIGSGDYIDIDYIYIGPLVDGAPPEDSLYFGFENTAKDQARYNSVTYGKINYDNPSNASKFYYVNTESATIDNATGTLTMIAEDKECSTFGFGPSNTLSFHPKDKTLQMRFKLEDFVPYSASEPVVYLQYDANNTTAGKLVSFDPEYLTNGKYVTVMVDLTESVAADFNNLNTVSKVRFIIGNIKSAPGKQGKITVDYAYLGPKDELKKDYKPPITYGYDSSYEADLTYSNDSTLMVEGSGIPVFNADYSINPDATKAYTVSTFTFTGTGFEIISRTGKDQGLIRAMVYDQEGNFVKAAQVLNKSDSELELYQVPVLSVEITDLETDQPLHGTYTVKLYVAEAYDFDDSILNMGGALDRGGQFYFDAVRIYNTIDINANTNEAKEAAAVYRRHGESDAKYEEIRQLLLDAETFSPVVDGSSVNGVIFLDNSGQEPTIANYTSYGPNNEVYLATGNAISFRLDVGEVIPASVDIGAKAVDGSAASMRIIADSKPSTSGGQSFSVATAVVQNYAITFDSADWTATDGGNQTYITIINEGDGILSLSKLKSAYNVITKPAQRSVRLMVDHALSHAVQCQMEKTYDNLSSGNHNVLCSCGEEYTESHSFQEGVCLCGALEAVEPAEDDLISIGEQLYLESDLAMHFRIREEKLTDYQITTAYLVVERDVYASDGTMTVDVQTITNHTIANGRLIFVYSGISAAQMNDEIRVTLFIKDKEGVEHRSAQKVTSVTNYAKTLLESMPSGYDKLYTVVMDMLNYGTAAQQYFNRHADAPANEAYAIFADYACYATADLTSPLEDLSKETSNDGAAAILSQTLELGTRIGIQYKVALPEGVNVEDVTLVIRDELDNELTSIPLSTGTVDSRGRYVVTFYGLASRQMRDVVTATAYVNNTAISATCAYSISTYAYEVATTQGMPENLINLTRLMVIYGDSAAVYFG